MRTLMLKSWGQFFGTEDTDVAAGDTPLSGDFPCPLILIDVTATQVLHGKFLFQNRSCRKGFETLAHPLHMVLVILEQDVVHVEINLHTVGMVEVPQRTAEQDTVQARDNPLDRILKTSEKLLHGVPFVWV